MEELLKFCNVNKSYGKVKVLNNISFTVNIGQITGIIGANGSGKSTLLRVAVGLAKKDNGEVTICGYNLDNDFSKAMGNINMCFDQFLFYEQFTGYENLKLVKDLIGQNCMDIKDVLNLIGLTDEMNKKVKYYSSGMKQRLALARTIMKKPKIVLLDEPINTLDPRGMKELYELTKTLSKENIGFLISSHMLYDVERHCTHVILLKNGSIVIQGEITDIVERYKMPLEEIYMQNC